MKTEADGGLKACPRKIEVTHPQFSLLIRPLEEDDAVCIHEAVIASREALLPFMNWAHQELSEDSQRARIREARKNFDIGLEHELGVFDQNTGEFLMASGLMPASRMNRKTLEIGYWTHSDHTNKGVATCVTRALIVVAFEFMKSDRIEISCNLKNISSRRVIEKCGFKFEGENRNYFEKPTEQMLKNSYVSERSCLRYALIPDDKPDLLWLNEITSSLSIR